MSAPPFPFTEEGVRAALKALGETAPVVAQRLADGGHLGTPGDCSSCPVARYLEAVIPLARSVSATEAAIAVYATSPGPPVVVLAPLPVARFIEAFDNAQFVELRA